MQTTVRESPVVLSILAVLVLAGLGLRIGYAVEQPATPPPDARAYERIADSTVRWSESGAGTNRSAQQRRGDDEARANHNHPPKG